MKRLFLALSSALCLLTLHAGDSTARSGGIDASGELPPRTTYVENFESPPVKPLAVGEDDVLYAVNTPAGHLLVIDTANDEMSVVEEIAVGLEPVTVAVQPGTASPVVWVANFLSDTVNVVDVETGVVTAVIEVPDEPVNILFDPTGGAAFVVSQVGTLTAIETATLAIADQIELECFSPRAAVLRDDILIVAALHSGNNTTTVGQDVTLEFADGDEIVTSTLAVASVFSLTRDLFEASDLAPWPTPPTNIGAPSPRAERIIRDAGEPEPGGWLDIIAPIDDGTGAPTAEAIDRLVEDFDELVGRDLVNPDAVLQTLLDDRWDTLDHDLVAVDVSNPAAMDVLSRLGGVGTTLTGMAVSPVNDHLLVSNLQARNSVRHEASLNGHVVDHEVVLLPNLDPANIVRTDLHGAIPNFNDVSQVNPEAQAGSLAFPVDLVFRNDGARVYVAALGADRVGVLDPEDGSVLGRVDVGRGPRGLALDSDRARLFAFNRTDSTISMVDVSTDSPSEVTRLELIDPAPEAVREGRDLLYTAKRSRNFASSCSLCHIDGRTDHLAWDLGRPDALLEPGPVDLDDPSTTAVNHPVKGPMLTMTLQGLDRHAPYHWRGDKPTFFDFNVAFADLLGGDRVPVRDMDRFRRFVESFVFPPTPFRDRDNSFLDPTAAAGEATYAVHCDFCHQLAHDGAHRGEGLESDSGTVLDTSGPQTMLVRQLRGLHTRLDSDLYSGFGLTHSGRMRRDDTDNLFDPLFALFPASLPTQQDIDDMTAFVTAFPSDLPPVVGWQVLPEAPVSASVRADLELIVELYEAGDCGVLANGFVGGERVSLALKTNEGGSSVFESIDGREFDLDTLLDGVDGGDQLFFLAIPADRRRQVLVLGSGDAGGDQLVLDALTDQGFAATLGVGPDAWDGTAESLMDFDAVLVLNSHNWSGPSMPLEGVGELTDYVALGGGLVTGERFTWNATLNGVHAELEPLLPVTATGLVATGETTTYSEATFDPIVGDGVATSFEVSLTEIDGAVESTLAAKPRATLFFGSDAGAGLVGWRFRAGRVMSFSTMIGAEELESLDYATLLGNSIEWVATAPE